MRSRTRTRTAGATVAAVALTLSAALPAFATPVATTEQERDLFGRVFLEPIQSTNYIQLGPENGPEELRLGMELLESLYPEYIEWGTLEEITGDPNAVSVGDDQLPPWHPDDTGDGRPLYVTILTDESVPDEEKAYSAIMFSHSAEACGREGATRLVEDMVMWATEDPDHVLHNATGITGESTEITVGELLKRTKVYVAYTSPDGWAAGDSPVPIAQHHQQNGAGINSNRVAYQTGWVFPNTETLYDKGYTVSTQPEGIAFTEYLKQVRRDELGGAPFATAADIHGPVPFGMILLHDQGNSPQKLKRIHDLGTRVKQNMDAVFESYVTGAGATAYALAAGGTESVIDFIDQYVPTGVAGSIPLQWATVSHIWDLLSYTAAATWGGWMNSDSGGLGADSLSYEINCHPTATYDPPVQQLLIDNVRAIISTTIVAAAAQQTATPFARDLGAPIGFYDDGTRVTDADGNPSPPPAGYPNNPIIPQIEQVPYDVSQTDYFRDLRSMTSTPIVEVTDERPLADQLAGLGTLVVADQAVVEDGSEQQLIDWVRAGGNLVLTDAALTMLPAMFSEVGEEDVRLHHSYVGYADLDMEHPLTEGIIPNARQTFDPIGIGYELLMERDGYWSCDFFTTCENSQTANAARIWTVTRTAWEALGGTTAGTADPPEDPQGELEGSATDKATIGQLELGEGRVTIFGALLPRPSEDYPHWYGLDAYAISVPGQDMLGTALTWDRVAVAGAPTDDGATPAPAPAPLPVTGGGLVALSLAAFGVATRLRRR